MTQTSTNTSSTTTNSDAKAANRCTFRFPNGSRCRLSVVDTSTGLCYSHAKLQLQHSDLADLSEELFPRLPEDKLPDLTTAEHINVLLSRIVLLLAQGRISPRRAAVMTFGGSLLLRCVTAMDRAPNFIFDLPRPKPFSSKENDPASPAEYSSRPHT